MLNPDLFAAQFRVWFGPDAAVSAARIQGEKDLYPEEQVCIAGAVPRRRVEFSTGRWCAREALRSLDLPPQAIPVGPFRGPVWPPGISGSISHAGGICVAVVSRTIHHKALGIDLLETAQALPIVEAAEPILSAPGEDMSPLKVSVDPRVLRFGAKESVIKAVSGEVGRWIDFTEIRVRFAASSFEASIDGFLPPVSGWWTSLGEFLLTAARL